MEAALIGDKDTVKALLKHGANVNAKDNNGATALMWGVKTKELELQNDLTWKILKSRCGLYDEKSITEARTGTMLADTIKILLENGADINMRDEDGWTALKLAEIRNNRKLVKLLKTPEATLSKQDVMELDFLRAAKNGNIKKARALINQGVDVNTKTDQGISGLMIATYWNNIEIVKLLIDGSANVNEKDNYGETALMRAARRGNTEIVELLKNAGAKDKK